MPLKLLIMTAILLIVLAVAFPHGTADRYVREMRISRAITIINTAEAEYYSQYRRYATTLAQLGPPASGQPGPNGAGLVDRDLASGEKGGFKFALQQTPVGYALAVTPTSFGISAAHTFFSDQSMAIHIHSGQEPATANDPFLGETQQQQQQTTPAR